MGIAGNDGAYINGENKFTWVSNNGTDWFKAKVDACCQNGDALYREISERDYGVDGIIELFKKWNTNRKNCICAD